jgi:hypothetical protein
MAKKIISGKGDLGAFVERVNSNHLARLQFLVDPVRSLDEAGIQLDDAYKAQIQALVHQYLERFPTAALLPTGRIPKAKDTSAPGEGGDDDDDITVLFA